MDELMANDEALREALIELDALRQREASALRESKALVQCLSAVATAPDPEMALSQLLSAIKSAIGCDLIAIIKETADGASVIVATDRTLIGAKAPTPPLKGKKPRRIVSLSNAAWWSETVGWPAMRSLLSMPVRLDGAKGALLCLATQDDGFSAADANILPRLSEVAAQALATVELTRHKRLLGRCDRRVGSQCLNWRYAIGRYAADLRERCIHNA